MTELLLILSQVPVPVIPEAPKSSDPTQWVGYLASVLAIVLASALAYLWRSGNEDRELAKGSITRLEQHLKDTIGQLNQINMAQRDEHKADRAVFQTIGEKITETQVGIAHRLERIDDKLNDALKGREPHG